MDEDRTYCDECGLMLWWDKGEAFIDEDGCVRCNDHTHANITA